MTPQKSHEKSIAEAAVDLIADDATPRLRELMTSLVTHLHAFVEETQLTQKEWEFAIDYLTRTGQMCTAERQEFILLSDVLGVSMLVDAINHPTDGGVSDSTVFGPFYTTEQPVMPNGASILKIEEPEAEPLIVSGTIKTTGGQPISGAKVEIWQTSPKGLYDVQDNDVPRGHLRGTFLTDDTGAYSFETIVPTCYPIPGDGPVGEFLRAVGRHNYRPAHTHFMITAPGYRPLVTHLFMSGDKYLESDAVFGVKDSLVVTPTKDGDHSVVNYNFVMADG